MPISPMTIREQDEMLARYAMEEGIKLGKKCAEGTILTEEEALDVKKFARDEWFRQGFDRGVALYDGEVEEKRTRSARVEEGRKEARRLLDLARTTAAPE